MSRTTLLFIIISLLSVALFATGLLLGSVEIPAKDVVASITGHHTSEVTRIIILENRLPALLTAALAGVNLSIAGLMMQRAFANPLAGPGIMGVSTGASLGVAIVVLAAPVFLISGGSTAQVIAAFIGAMGVMGILISCSAAFRSPTILLIIGVLIGYLASSAISLLNFFAPSESIQKYVFWGLGSFTATSLSDLAFFGPLSAILWLAGVLFIKGLNALLLGERYAENLGINTRRLRTCLLTLAGALTAVTTAWCGPIGFIGLAVPHFARLIFRRELHSVLYFATALCGLFTGLLCQVLSTAPALTRGVIPVNALTPLVGIPVILYLLVRERKNLAR